MAIRHATIRLLAICGLLLMAGCQDGATASSLDESPRSADGSPMGASASRAYRPGLLPMSRPPITDLPVPVGFKMVESVSRSYETPDGRTIDHAYEGYEDKFAVERFYRTQMPAKGWSELSTQLLRGEYEIRFAKGPETCLVRITSQSSLAGERTRVNLTVNEQTATAPAPAAAELPADP